MNSEWMWGLACIGFAGLLIVLLYLRERSHIKRRHNHIAGKIDAVHEKVDAVKSIVEGTRLEAKIAATETRSQTGYIAGMVEGARKDANTAAEGIRTAQHASDEAAELRGDTSLDALKGFQLTIWQHFTELIKKAAHDAVRAILGKNHDPPKPPDDTSALQ